MSDRTEAPAIFLGIAPQYSWMGAVMSFGQDGRWRRFMVSKVNAVPGAQVLVRVAHARGGEPDADLAVPRLVQLEFGNLPRLAGFPDDRCPRSHDVERNDR